MAKRTIKLMVINPHHNYDIRLAMVHKYLKDCHCFSFRRVNSLKEDVHFVYDIYLH